MEDKPINQNPGSYGELKENQYKYFVSIIWFDNNFIEWLCEQTNVDDWSYGKENETSHHYLGY